MAHDHAHTHGNTYYIDQLCTIASCGALGGVSVMMYFGGRIGLILAPQFYLPVVIGGFGLVVMVVIRAITLWREAGQVAAHEHHHHHDHDHGHDHDHHHDHDHDHDHDHAHDHGHDHTHADHGHDHGWTPARYAVLMLPIALFFLNLPNSSFSQATIGRMLESGEVAATSSVESKAGMVLGFKELAQAAYYPDTREAMQGKTGKMAGMFQPVPGNDKQFTLYRLNMTCCQADAVPVEVRIVCDENITRFKAGDWVEAEGQIQFHKVPGRDKYLAVLYLKSADQVRPTARRTGMEL